MKIILASNSPRRKELMDKIGLDYEIDPADIDERAFEEKSAIKSAEVLAIKKAESVAARHPNSLVIGSDLVVAYMDHQIGKPIDGTDAKKILQLLCGKTHQVMTGVAVINTATNKTVAEVDVTNVTMRDYTEKEIDDYIATGEPFGKGGAYAIQGLGGKLVKGFDGDIETVIGLPTKVLLKLLEKVK